jgi:transcription antitermination factor NusG
MGLTEREPCSGAGRKGFSGMHTPSNWYALAVKPQHEKSAERALAFQGLEGFLPCYRSRRHWTDRVKEIELPLFPGYLFCRIGLEERLKVLTSPGVVAIVSFGGRPAPVSPEEISALRRLAGSNTRLQPWPYLKAGQRVRIERGPLGGLEGILVRSKDFWRVVVSVDLLRRSVAVEIDREAIAPLLSAGTRPLAVCACCV